MWLFPKNFGTSCLKVFDFPLKKKSNSFLFSWKHFFPLKILDFIKNILSWKCLPFIPQKRSNFSKIFSRKKCPTFELTLNLLNWLSQTYDFKLKLFCHTACFFLFLILFFQSGKKKYDFYLKYIDIFRKLFISKRAQAWSWVPICWAPALSGRSCRLPWWLAMWTKKKTTPHPPKKITITNKKRCNF